MKCNESSRTKTRTQNQRQPKVPFSTVDFSKVDPLYKCRSVSFYREASGLFTFWGCPRMNRIETEDARIFLGGLQWGLHVIGSSWRHAANRGAFLVAITCTCREKTFNLLETPLSPGASHHMKHGLHSNLKTLDVRDDETPWAKPRLRLAGWVRFISGGFVVGKTEWLDRDPNALGCWVYLAAPQVTKGNGRKMGSEKWKWFWKLLGFRRRAFRIELRTAENTLLFWYMKGLIPNPPNTVLSVLGVHATVFSSPSILEPCLGSIFCVVAPFPPFQVGLGSYHLKLRVRTNVEHVLCFIICSNN
jgi:hypothetical protein